VAAQREGARPNEQWAPALQQRGLWEEARLEDRGAMLGRRRTDRGAVLGVATGRHGHRLAWWLARRSGAALVAYYGCGRQGFRFSFYF
jgi:hypothetical protein